MSHQQTLIYVCDRCTLRVPAHDNDSLPLNWSSLRYNNNDQAGNFDLCIDCTAIARGVIKQLMAGRRAHYFRRDGSPDGEHVCGICGANELSAAGRAECPKGSP